jgi:hypothetical protein
MASNRRSRAKGALDEKKSSWKVADLAAPPVESAPAPELAVAPAVAAPNQGNAWAALLKTSPWSSNQAENKPDEPQDIPKLAALGPPETAPVGDLLAQWSPQIWRLPAQVHDDGDAAEIEQRPEPFVNMDTEHAPSQGAVSEIPAEPEAVHDNSMTGTEGDTQMISVETEAEIALESEVLVAPVVAEPLPESETDVPLSEASMADDHLTMIPDPDVVVDEPIGIPNPVEEASVAASAVSSVKEVPVEDLFSGIFNVANAALRNAISLSTEVANDPKAVGGKIAARSQSLLASFKERCGIRRI